MRKSDKWIGLIIGLMLGGTVLIGSGIVQNVMTSLGDTIYGGILGQPTRLAGNTTTTTKVLTQTGDGVNSAAPSWQIVPTGGTLTYYFTNTASSPTAAYKQMTVPPYTPKTTLTTAAVGTGTTVLQNFATNAGTPGLTFIPAGQYEFHVHASKPAGTKAITLQCQFWEVSSTEVDIQLIGTSEPSAALTGSEIEYRLFFADANTVTLASDGSRIVARVQAIGAAAGSAATVDLFVGDEADSHIALPSPTVDVSNFVPYSGATGNVDLGTHSITVASCTGCGGGGGGGTPGSTLFSATANAGPNDSAAETSLIGAVVGSTTIPGATFTNGAVLEARSQGYYSLPTVADTLTLKAKCGSTVIGSASFTPAAGALTNGTFRFWLMITARGTGAGGSFSTNGIAQFTGSTLTGGPVSKILNASPVAFDFTSSCVFDMTAQWGGAQVGELMTGTDAAAWIPGAPVISVNGATGAITGLLRVNGFYLSDGTNFYIGPTFQLATLPVAGSFAWVNQGGASETASGNALVLSAPTGAGDNLRLRVQNIGANTKLTVNMSCTAQVANFQSCGVAFYESGTGKVIDFVNNIQNNQTNCVPSGSTNGCSGNALAVNRFTNVTTFSAAELEQNFTPFTTQWLQIEFSSDTLFFRTSQDGVNFVLHYSEAKNAFFTTAPNQWGYVANANNNVGTQPTTATLFSFKME